MNTYQRERVESLINLLENLPERNFDMGRFTDEETHSHRSGHDHDAAQEIECGTACCVAGWAAIDNRKDWPRRTGWNHQIMSADAFGEFYGLPGIETELGLFDCSWAKQICHEGFDMTAQEKAAQLRAMLVSVPVEGSPS